VSGALFRKDKVVAIAINARQSPKRKRFTIAHELAHYLLGHKDEDHIDWEFTVIRRDGKSSEATDVQEIEANAFAANLLMPKMFVFRDVERFKNYSGEVEINEAARQFLAMKYEVSELALNFRLTNLGLISPF
jgi:Zn-dependent peptidase ImmA (M78 family)